DAGFNIGRVKVQLEGAHGGIGALTVAPFSFGDENLLAYAARAGIMVTNGETWSILTKDVDCSRVHPTNLNTVFLVNTSMEFRLEFTYTPIGGDENSETMFLHYHPSHAKVGENGKMLVKITRPIRRGGIAKTSANINGLDVIFSLQSNGKVYQ